VKSFDISVRMTKVLTSFDCIIKSRHRPAFDDYYSVHSDCILYLDLRFWSNTYDMKDQIIWIRIWYWTWRYLTLNGWKWWYFILKIISQPSVKPSVFKYRTIFIMEFMKGPLTAKVLDIRPTWIKIFKSWMVQKFYSSYHMTHVISIICIQYRQVFESIKYC